MLSGVRIFSDDTEMLGVALCTVPRVNGIGIAGVDDGHVVGALRQDDVERRIQEHLVDVEPVAAAHRGAAVLERIPDHAEPRREVVGVVGHADDPAEARSRDRSECPC